ncbi:MAG: hypothetical protein L6E13_03005 [Firmicutes bacterium]|nr:hypothetical protein [Bacillota bacterium]
MTRYWIVMAILALAVGGLFQAVARYQIPLLKMAGMIGLLLMGVVGSLAVSRQQTDRGRRRVEAALKALEPDFIITDWAEGRGPAAAPEYLVVGPGGLAAVVLDPMPQSTWRRRVPKRLAAARDRARAAAEWVVATGRAAGVTVPPPLPVVVLTRRLVEPGEEEQGGVLVLNPEHLGDRLRQLGSPERLDAQERVRITRRLRQAADRQAAAGKGLPGAR